MTPENFCYWLQGWFELNQTLENNTTISNDTLIMIKNHLDLVFKKETLGYELLNTKFTDVSTDLYC